MKNPTQNKVRQARHAARDAGKPGNPRAISAAVGIVRDLQTSPDGLEYLRRVVARDLGDDIRKLERLAPKPGQSREEFAAVHRTKETKVAFLQDLLAAIERASVDPSPF